jgi:hypothetical protein
VDDIVVHPRRNDIVLGTHGRSLIVLDDAALLAAGDPAKVARPQLMRPAPAYMTYAARAMPSAGGGRFEGHNAPAGALFTWVLPAGTASGDSVTLTVRNQAGAVVRELRAAARAGVSRISWDLRYALPFTPVAGDAVWFGPPKGVWVLPGEYAVTLRTPAGESSTTLAVHADPRVDAPASALVERHAAGMRVNALLTRWSAADKALGEMGQALGADSSGTRGAEYRRLRQVFRSGWLSLKSQVLDLHGAVQGASAAPSQGQVRTLAVLEQRMAHAVQDLNRVIRRGGTRAGWPRPI